MKIHAAKHTHLRSSKSVKEKLAKTETIKKMRKPRKQAKKGTSLKEEFTSDSLQDVFVLPEGDFETQSTDLMMFSEVEYMGYEYPSIMENIDYEGYNNEWTN